MVNFTECIEDIRTNHGFKHNSHDDSFYRTYQIEGGKFLQLRVSNHGTYLCTWIEEDYDPSLALSNISIVFTEDGKCESNTAVDMGDKKRSYKVIQYIYNCAVLDNNDILRINNRMYDIITNRGYIDPLSDNETKKAKVYTLEPNQKPQLLTQPIQENNNKQINTNKIVMKLNESQLRKIIKESIKQVLMEGGHLYTKDTDGNVYTTSKETWRGVPNTTFVSHGEWSDPEIIYQGCSLNYYDVEDLLEYNYQEDVKSGYQGSFEDWISERDVTELESILDSIICEY